MVNVTVIKGKDAIKNLVRISIVMILFFILTRFFTGFKEAKTFTKISKQENYSLISCLDETIPQAKQMQTKQEDEEKKEDNNATFVLKSELGIFDAIEKKNDVALQKLVNEESSISTDTTILENTNNNKNTTVEQAQTDVKTEVIETNVPNKFTNTYNGVQIKNESGLSFLDKDLDFDFSFNTKDVLIFHTHTCESYTSSSNFTYEQNGSFRTTDLNFSVSRVGDELENQLKSYGINVLHDKTYHDYPAYSGSYARSLTTVQNLLNTSSDADVVIDIHRDAIADSTYAPKVKIGDEYASQMMFVIGTNGSGLDHDNWIQNLKFAVMVQEKANELYPGLFKPIIVRSSRYNQHLAKCACIIEVGATGNTLDESNNSMKYLAKILSEIMK